MGQGLWSYCSSWSQIQQDEDTLSDLETQQDQDTQQYLDNQQDQSSPIEHVEQLPQVLQPSQSKKNKTKKQPHQQEQGLNDVDHPIQKKTCLNEDILENSGSGQIIQMQDQSIWQSEFTLSEIKFEVPSEILNVLKDHSNQHLFRKQLKKVLGENNLIFTINSINFDHQQIEIEVKYLNSQINYIRDVIKQQIINELVLKEINYSLENMLYFLNQDQQGFLSLNCCYMKLVNSQNFQFVTLKQYEEQIEHIFSQILQQIIKISYQFNQKKWDYLMKYQYHQVSQIMKDNKCLYDMTDIEQKQQLENQLLIQYGNIQNWYCDAIVDPFDQSQEEKSFHFFDQEYKQFCNLRIRNCNDVRLQVYEMKNQQNIIFSVGKKLQSTTINEIFEKAKQMNNKTLAFPGSLFYGIQMQLLDDIRKEATLSQTIKVMIIDNNYNRFDLIAKFAQTKIGPAIITLPHYMDPTQLSQLQQFLDHGSKLVNREQEQQNQQNQFIINRVNQNIKQIQPIQITTINQDNFINAKTKLKGLIQMETLNIHIPNFNEEDLIKFENFLFKNAVKFDRQKIKSMNLVHIDCFKSKTYKIIQHLTQQKSYPSDWEPQDQNFHKSMLNQTSEEFINLSDQLKQEFKEMKEMQLRKQMEDIMVEKYQDIKINQINRLQNKQLYENFINQKNKLIKQAKNEHIILTQEELDRYLWHGVQKYHPKIVYEGQYEGFKTNFCRNEYDKKTEDIKLWSGRGIYFASNSQVAHKYAHLLEDGDFKGKYVMLLCQVSTGRCLYIYKNKILFQEPPYGYHCVERDENHFPTFCLYDMDVRRAYPAYEVIYEFE